MREWPDDGSPVSMEDLATGIVKAIRFAYRLKRQNADLDVPYTGYNIGEQALANCFDPVTQLTAEKLRYSKYDQGREAIDEIVALAVRLGIEQGRRITMTGSEFRTLRIEAKVGKMLMGSLDDLPD
jgi:hypothetical protein